jgi:repressor LexA
METLTQRQQQILDFIADSQRETGQTPSLREIAGHFGFRSPNAARDHVNALCQKGVLERPPGRARSLHIVNPLQAFRQAVADIPVYGTIPAGFADEREQEAVGCISVDVQSLGIRPTARTFSLKVRGDSMIGRHIVEGDHVICEHGKTPRSGDIVAALIDNESTLKTYIESKGRPYLKAENPKYPNLLPAHELLIQGVVVGMLRNFSN